MVDLLPGIIQTACATFPTSKSEDRREDHISGPIYNIAGSHVRVGTVGTQHCCPMEQSKGSARASDGSVRVKCPAMAVERCSNAD